MIAQTRSPLGRRLAWLVTVGLTVAALLAPSSTALAADPKTEITICHATGSQGNPYVVNSPAINSSGAFAGELAAGHNDHIGPLWFPGIQVTWGDIIPPYEYPPANFVYAGLNWTPEGQAIYNNGCNIPAQATPTPTLAPTPTPTLEPTPTPPGPTPSPTPSPTGGVGGATGTPPPAATADPTLPTTSTLDGTGSGPTSDGWRLILLAMAGLLAAALLLTPARAVVRKDDASR